MPAVADVALAIATATLTFGIVSLAAEMDDESFQMKTLVAGGAGTLVFLGSAYVGFTRAADCEERVIRARAAP